MDLDSKIQANTQGFFVLTFFNEREKSLTERTIHYIFSKFGQVSEIKYAEHGPVFISYKEKEEALKALEIMNMGSKYHVEIDWQPVKKNETTESTKREGEDSFIYLRCPPKWKKRLTAYVSIELFGFKEPGDPITKNFVFSRHFKGYMKIVFDSKRARDEILEKHQNNPFKWPKDIGGDFEFCDDLPSVKGENSFVYLHITPKFKGLGLGLASYVTDRLEANGAGKPFFHCDFSWLYRGHMKIVFDSKRVKDEIMEKHQKNPLKWPKGVGGDFEFFDDLPCVEGENSFIYLHTTPKFEGSVASYVTDRLSVFTEAGDVCRPFHYDFSWLYKGHMKIVFDSKRVKDEIMEKHQKNPLKWPKGVGGDFEFFDDLPIVYIRRPSFNASYLPENLKPILFGSFGSREKKTKIRSIDWSKCGKLLMVVFYANITKDEVMKAHNKKPFVWRGRENMEALEFLNTSEALAMFDKKKED